MGVLSATELAAIAAPQITLVSCPDLQAEIPIRKPPMSASLKILDRLKAAGIDGKTEDDKIPTAVLVDLQGELFALCVCDEEGRAVWDRAMADTFSANHTDTAGLLFDAIVELLGFTEVPDATDPKASPDP